MQPIAACGWSFSSQSCARASHCAQQGEKHQSGSLERRAESQASELNWLMKTLRSRRCESTRPRYNSRNRATHPVAALALSADSRISQTRTIQFGGAVDHWRTPPQGPTGPRQVGRRTRQHRAPGISRVPANQPKYLRGTLCASPNLKSIAGTTKNALALTLRGTQNFGVWVSGVARAALQPKSS